MAVFGNVHKILKFSAVDGPGNRSAVFLQGCNFNCAYCHNPETIPGLEANLMPAADVLSFLGDALHFVRGVTVSGGEPMLQKDFVMELFTLLQDKNLSAFIDTNGSVDFSKENELLKITGGVMLDVKAVNNSEHIALTGRDNFTTLKNLEYLAYLSKLYEVRTVVSPNMFDCEATIEYVSKIIGRYNIRYKIIKYRPVGVRKEYAIYKVPNAAFLDKLKQIAISNGVKEVVII
ncbi:MAG: radical SAM protein [Clostridiales bacterium]|jgi:pyruvate formate lyase activating enzyme|nr:radical SAM protein [Clostridiales bacterium]